VVAPTRLPSSTTRPTPGTPRSTRCRWPGGPDPDGAGGVRLKCSGVPASRDATQSVGQFPIDVETIGCDRLSGTGRKFLRGPRGTGFLWVRGAAIDRLDPFVAEIRSATWDGDRGFTRAEGARRFESWENSYVNILGLRAAVRQALDLGLEAIAERSVSLGAQLRERLDALPVVHTHDLGETPCAIVTASVDGVPRPSMACPPLTSGRTLRDQASTSPPPSPSTPNSIPRTALHPLVRFSPHYYNTSTSSNRPCGRSPP
jgi:selenocysteine lyase/cysteine desulfurase